MYKMKFFIYNYCNKMRKTSKSVSSSASFVSSSSSLVSSNDSQSRQMSLFELGVSNKTTTSSSSSSTKRKTESTQNVDNSPQSQFIVSQMKDIQKLMLKHHNCDVSLNSMTTLWNRLCQDYSIVDSEYESLTLIGC